ncbi:MAG TPA: GYD domain-containing protein [Myxococcales bacterium]|nr:GYD domain-containing protein [Myxococcales bacterium]
MPKYLVQASYTAEGVQGLLKEGGTARMKVVRQLIEGAGGKIEAHYFAFGKHDVVVIADLPDNVTAVALSLTVAAAGVIHLVTTPLLTAEEIDGATKKTAKYRKPGA